MKKPLMLLILDGWGINENPTEKNAIKEANPENFYRLVNTYPHSKLQASGEEVGLPEGQMGNSEVGHLNIGSGRIIYQPLAEISKDVKDGSFFRKPSLMEAFQYAKDNNVNLHFGGLVSDGGVHSHITHIYALIQMAKNYDLQNLYLHGILDGRDTPPQSGAQFWKDIEDKMNEIGIGKMATITGRYYAMDRDKNWDRVELAYNAMVNGIGNESTSVAEAMNNSYSNKIVDEFVVPTIIDREGLIKNGDVFINFNFRPDRAREITRALNDKEFPHFEREYLGLKYYCMRQYDATIDAKVVYTDKEIKNTFGEIISKAGLSQLRTAETEKYAHVTFFFNGGVEEPYPGEDRKLINSPKVATYDLKPEMSAIQLTDSVIEEIKKDKYDVIILNFANPDMVGHTGIFDAAIEAIKTIDISLGKIVDAILSQDGTLIVIADHGNAEKMEDPITGVPFTAHTSNAVPFILVSEKYKSAAVNDGKLADVAPTILDILNISQPDDMTGVSLIKK